jgi:hypothetical protein
MKRKESSSPLPEDIPMPGDVAGSDHGASHMDEDVDYPSLLLDVKKCKISSTPGEIR